MQLNNKSRLLVFLIYGLILSALITRDGDLLLLAIPLLAYLLIGIAQTPGSINLKIIRSVDKSSVIASEPLTVQITVENQGAQLAYLHLKDRGSPSLEIIEGSTETLTSLPSGEKAEFNYRVTAPRDVLVWEDVQAHSCDPLGLFETYLNIPAAGQVLVRPAPMQIRPITLKPRATLHTAGPIPARLAGRGTDFWGVREFRPGDSFRWINWRLTNRHPNKMFTNEYEREEIADYGILLDARNLTESVSLEEEIFEYSVSAIASLSEQFLRTGNRVSLLILGKPLLQVFPGYGKNQLNTLLVNLSHAKLGGNIKFRNLEYFPSRLFPNRSLLLVFSLVGPRDLKAYSRMKAYGYDVLLISPNLIEHAHRPSAQNELNSLAYRTAKIERAVQLQQIRKLGVNVIDWNISQPIGPILYETAQAMLHKRN
jgi:uncharacterized protein (DUF58 family)